MSRTNFINQFSSEKITLAHVHGSARLFNWALHSGSVYKRSVPYFVYSLKQDSTPLTSVSSLGSVTAGTYFYDSAAGELYVQTVGSTNPQTDEEMIVTYRLFYGSAPVTCSWDLTNSGNHVHYEGRIQLAPPFKHKIAVEQNLVSIIGNGSLKLINTDGGLDDVYDALIFDNHEIQIYSWNRDLPFADARIIYRGRVTNKRFQKDNVAFLVKDMLFDLDQIVPQETYDDNDNVTDDVKGTKKRWVYGRVDGLKLQSISQIGEGYPITGTVSMAVTSQALIGVGTAFLSECSPGDTITIGTLEFKIESVQSNTELTLDDTPEYAQSGVVATLKPEIPTTVKNREFFVAGHATARLTKTVVKVIQFNRIELSDTTNIEPGDFLEFTTGERIEVKNTAPGNIVVLRKNVIVKPTVGSAVTRQPIQQVFVESEDVLSTKYTISNQGAPTNETKLTFDSDVEFTLARNKQLNVAFTFTNGSRIATTVDDVDLTEIIETRDFVRPTDLSYTTYYEVLSVGEGRVLTGTVAGNPNTLILTGSGTNFTAEVSPGDTIIVAGKNLSVDSVDSAVQITLDSEPDWEFSGLSFRKQDEKAIELRTAFADPTHTGPTEGKLPDYIGDDTIVSTNLLGRTIDGEPDGTWITTAAQAMRDLIRVAGVTEVNETSFTTGATENRQLISIMLPLSASSDGVTYKQIIDKLAQSTKSVVTLDNNLQLKYKAVQAEIPDNPIIISDFDVVDWNIETVNGNNIRNTVVRYRFKDIDRYTQESGQLSLSYSSEFVEKYVGTNKTEELDVYLYRTSDAEIIAHRNTYLHSLGRADIQITTDLRYEDVEIGDTVILNFRRLYKRFGDSNSRQKAVMIVGKKLDGTRTILDLSDIGNIFNRSSIITPNSAPDFSTASELEKIKYGYITSNIGIVDNDEDTANIHLIS